jgi:hypothetical protein
MLRTALAAAFGLEAILTMSWLARFATMAPAYDTTVWIMVALRAAVTVVQGVAAWLLLQRAPPADLFARAAVLSAAVVLTLEIGARLAPSSLPPGTRTPLIAAYWIYAAIVTLALRPPRMPS